MKKDQIIKKILSEINKTQPNEGVADKFVKQDPGLIGVPTYDQDFEQYHDSNIGDIIYTDGDWHIIKNPKSLDEFPPYVRGVITTNGDLYIEFPAERIHNDILTVLKGKGLVPENTGKKWGGTLPQESGFLTVQRYRDSNILAIGESNRLIYDKENWNKYIKHYDEFLNKARSISPKIQYTNKLIGIKFPKGTSYGSDNIMTPLK